MNTLLSAIKDPGTVIVAVVGVFGAVLTSWYQARKSHQSQIALLHASRQREEEVRQRQFEEADRADRLLIMEYIDQLLPRLCDITSIYFLSGTDANRNDEERNLFLQLQQYMNATNINPAHPERTLSIRLAFLVFQVIAAMRVALNARWIRPLSDEQGRFLAHYESHLEPLFCSSRYPGDEFLYREQIEIIADEMLATKQQGIIRPLNWNEFVQRYEAGGVLRTLTDLVAGKLRFVFDDRNPRTVPPRRSTQCRLAILSLYLIHMSEEAGNTNWTRRAEGIWRVVTNWFAWEKQEGQNPLWYVFHRGDVMEHLEGKPSDIVGTVHP